MPFGLDAGNANHVLGLANQAAEHLAVLGQRVQNTETMYADVLKSDSGRNMQHNVDLWQTYHAALTRDNNDVIEAATSALNTSIQHNDATK